MGARPSSFMLTSPGSLRLYSTQELLALKPPAWMVDNILPEGGLAVLYAPPESFKSFVALDMALCVASGVPWQGHDVQKGYSIYVAAEGGPGIGKRARAWLLTQRMKPSVPDIAWLIESIAVSNGSEDVERLIERIDNELEQVPTLIVIDTLARCFEGNENEQEAMGGFVGAIDHLRHEYGTAVLAVHHTRLDGDRERGNTALRGGLDTMLSIARGADETILVSCAKQKDAEHFPDIELKLLRVPAADSCVLERSTTGHEHIAILLDVLRQHAPLPAAEFQRKVGATGLSKRTFYRALGLALEERKILRKGRDYQIVGATLD